MIFKTDGRVTARNNLRVGDLVKVTPWWSRNAGRHPFIGVVESASSAYVRVVVVYNYMEEKALGYTEPGKVFLTNLSVDFVELVLP